MLGAGHNGLVAAFYLAKAGLKPLVLERREHVGGVAVTEEFHPGFRCSAVLHAEGPLRSDVARDLKLKMEMLRPDPRLTALGADGRALPLYEDINKTAGAIAQFSARDGERYPEFAKTLRQVSAVIAEVLTLTPPDIDDPSMRDALGMLNAGRKFRALGRKDMFRLLRWGPMAVADFVGEWFETELLRAALAARGIFGLNFGPWSAGSTMALMLHAAADPHPAGTAAFPRGGMGALAEALADAARSAGAQIRTGAEVAHILVKDGAVRGVALASGEELSADAVISSADPRRTFLKLIDPTQLEPSFIAKLQNYRSRGVTAKVHLALGAKPKFKALPEVPAGRIHIGHEIDYLERAFDGSKYGRLPEHPYLDVSVPTVLDASLAPAGKHVMSVAVHHAPYRLRATDWSSQRENLGETVVSTLEQHAPGLSALIEGRQVLTPVDLEQRYGLTGGHIFHGDLSIDQLFTMRPLLGWARYRGPLKGLYLCGSGTHPGNGLTGGSGANAAKEIAKELR
ncbi:MAG TPA: NAD(P)/FAD-dependent oxidoreductase [Terriglobales bacterium]|nr:NAD(P)/FAD-dependent oxidoreductase [Terriglobales bacterium]